MSPIDLRDDARSEQLRHDAIQRGFLQDTPPDRLNFFAGIAHALRVATSNPCGLLRTLVEKGLWHFLTQADEDKALRRLRRVSEEQETQQAAQVCQAFFARTPAHEDAQKTEHPGALSQEAETCQEKRRVSEEEETQQAAQVCQAFFASTPVHEDAQEAEHPRALSQDAETFQIYTRAFERAQLPGGLESVQEQGHLRDWSQERWDRALLELAQARLMRARQQDAATGLPGIQDMRGESGDEDDAQRDWD